MSYFSSPPAQVRLLGRNWPTFQLWLLAGLVAGPAAALALAAAKGLEPLAMLVIALLALGGFLALARLSSRRDGRERLFYYPAENAALLLATLFLLATGRPLLPYFDLLAIGLGGTYAFVRLGCHHAGCCHGRAARHGVRYGSQHVAEGFPAAYAGRPLFPLQALEAALIAVLTAAGAFLAAGSAPPGSALCCWLGGYAVARFFLDFLRADPETPFLGALTAAQWNALARSWLAAFLAARLGSPLVIWLALGAAFLTAAAAARLRPARGKAAAAALRSPRGRHLVADALAAAETPPEPGRPPEIRRLGGGLFFSCGCLESGKITHVTLSHPAGPIAPATLAALAEAVRASRPRLAAPRLFASGSGIVHLLFDHPES